MQAEARRLQKIKVEIEGVESFMKNKSIKINSAVLESSSDDEDQQEQKTQTGRFIKG